MLNYFIIIFCISLIFYSVGESNASPSFPRQEIIDKPQDWQDLETQKNTKEGGESQSDIILVNYFSDGQELNATIWLRLPVSASPYTVNELTYGMLVDADNDETTGIRGVDYVIEIKWEDNKWTRIFTELSSHKEIRIIEKSELDAEFFSEKDKRFVILSANLKSMGSPDEYKVAFFTQEVTGGQIKNEIADFTSWVFVPHPDFIITTNPSPAVIRAGEEQVVEVFVESTSGFEPEIKLLPIPMENFDLDFSPNIFNMTSFGISSTSLVIEVDSQVEVRPHTFLVQADATFPSESAESQIFKDSSYKIPELKGEKITKTAKVAVTILPPIPLHQKLLDILSQAEAIIGIIISIGTAVNVYFISKFRKTKKQLETENTSS